MRTETILVNLRRALETLWTDVGALSRNPLVQQLGLMEGWSEEDKRDAYKRASALIDAVLAAAQRLRANGNREAFALLNRGYGLERRRFEMGPPSAAPSELAEEAGLTVAEYERRLEATLRDLRSFL